jgi:hypothetical protein
VEEFAFTLKVEAEYSTESLITIYQTTGATSHKDIAASLKMLGHGQPGAQCKQQWQ